MWISKTEVSVDTVFPIFDWVQMTPADDCVKNLEVIHDSAFWRREVNVPLF